MSKIRSEVEKRAQSAIIQYALFRWESAVVVGGAILLTFFFWLFKVPLPLNLPFWSWSVLGALGWGAIVVSSLTDVESNAKVLLELYQEQFDPRQITDPALRQDVETALEYQRRIEALIQRERSSSVLRERLEYTAGQLAEWVGNIHQLALRLDTYRRDPLLAQERATAPKELDALVSRLEYEKNADVREQLREVVEGKRKQWESLRALDAKMQQAELQVEQSLTALATIYSQVQLVSAQDIKSGRSERLRKEIQEQVERLNDLVESINEVYDYHGTAI